MYLDIKKKKSKKYFCVYHDNANSKNSTVFLQYNLQFLKDVVTKDSDNTISMNAQTAYWQAKLHVRMVFLFSMHCLRSTHAKHG